MEGFTCDYHIWCQKHAIHNVLLLQVKRRISQRKRNLLEAKTTRIRYICNQLILDLDYCFTNTFLLCTASLADLKSGNPTVSPPTPPTTTQDMDYAAQVEDLQLKVTHLFHMPSRSTIHHITYYAYTTL